MNIVKWMRKNNRKIMAFVVIFIMVSFVGGMALQQLLMQFGSGRNRDVYTYRGNGKISMIDVQQAESDLTILATMQMPLFLLQYPTLKAKLLGQLLFPDSQNAPALYDEMKSGIARGGLRIEQGDIDRFFTTDTATSPILWILLRAEAREAGCIVPRENAAGMLKAIIPQLTRNWPQGAFSAAQMVEYMIKRNHVPEEKILDTLADLLAVLSYVQMVTSSEDITLAQLRATVVRRGQYQNQLGPETVSAEFVRFAAEDFVDQQGEPTQTELEQQLNAFKEYHAGQITEVNPYGFGYKLPGRVRLEYIIVKHDDVRNSLKEPTANEMEQFYQDNLILFQYEDQTDPNDPDSKVTKTMTYPEVMSRIKQTVRRQKTNRTVEMIINEARSKAESPFEDIDVRQASSEILAAAADDYSKIAEQVGKNYGLKLYAGQTGLLGAEGIAGDISLSKLSLQGQSRTPVRLGRIVFAVEQLGITKLSRFEVPAPKMWENIGPMKDSPGEYAGMVAIVRIIEAQPAEAPANIDVAFNIEGSSVGGPTVSKDKAFSVRDELVRDIKLIKAIAMAKTRTDEFGRMVRDSDWDKALVQYNDKYGDGEGSASKPGSKQVKLEKMIDKSPMSPQDIKASLVIMEDNPMAIRYIKDMVKTAKLAERFRTLLEDEKIEAKDIRAVVELKSSAAFYVVKDVSRKAVTKEAYYKAKGATAWQLDNTVSDSIALTHFMPENIIARMKFVPIRARNKVSDESTTTPQDNDRDGKDDQNAGDTSEGVSE